VTLQNSVWHFAGDLRTYSGAIYVRSIDSTAISEATIFFGRKSAQLTAVFDRIRPSMSNIRLI
jgi:hypothetical protein